MFCSNCGQLLKEGSKFCSNCGAKVAQPVFTAPAETEEPVAVEPAVEEVVRTAEVPEVDPEPVQTETGIEEPVVSEPEPAVEAPVEEPVTPVVEEPVEAPVVEPVSEPAPEVSAPEPEPVKETVMPAEPVKTPEPKKKKLSPLMIAGIVLALLVACFGIYNILPSTKFNRAVKAAETFYEQSDYASAAEEYIKALTIRPQDAEISEAASEVAINRSAQLLGDGDAEGSLQILERMLPLVAEEYTPYMKEMAAESYRQMSTELLDLEDFDSAIALLMEGADKGYDLADDISDAEKLKEYQGVKEKEVAFLKTLVPLLDAEDYEGALDAINGQLADLKFDYLQYGMPKPVITDVSGSKYKKIGLYHENEYFTVYYGDYDGTSRDGTGIYLLTDSGGIFTLKCRTYVVGDWDNDAPNGNMRETKKIYSGDELVIDQVRIGPVTEGIYNGDFEIIRDGMSFYGSYSNGKINVLDETDPNGEANRVTMYNNDHSQWLYYTDDASYNKTFGLIGWGSQ